MQPTAVQVAEDLFRIHELINGSVMYGQAGIIKLLIKYQIPEPDFDGYSKITKTKGSKSTRNKKKLQTLSDKIKEAMDQKGITPEILAEMANRSLPTIYRWLSPKNHTVVTIMELEALLNTKFINL